MLLSVCKRPDKTAVLRNQFVDASVNSDEPELHSGKLRGEMKKNRNVEIIDPCIMVSEYMRFEHDFNKPEF